MFRYTSFVIASAIFVFSATVASAQQQPATRLPAATATETVKTVTVQNDRASAVTLFVDVGRVDRAIGTIAAGEIGTIALPEWATKGKRAVQVVARAQGESGEAATYTLPMNESRPLGVLVPPRGGVPTVDSVLVTLPAGAANKATVTVNNTRSTPVTVYAEQGLLFVPLGEVSARSEATLVMPETLLKRSGEIRVFTRAGASDVATRALKLKAGDHVSVIVM
jgi:hypothetical protein